jgi:hypothetical protein
VTGLSPKQVNGGTTIRSKNAAINNLSVILDYDSMSDHKILANKYITADSKRTYYTASVDLNVITDFHPDIL